MYGRVLEVLFAISSLRKDTPDARRRQTASVLLRRMRDGAAAGAGSPLTPPEVKKSPGDLA